MDRRNFLKTGVAAVVGATAARARHATCEEPAIGPETIATRTFGKTACQLPILGYGGAALPKAWHNPLSTEDRVDLVRYAFSQGVRFLNIGMRLKEEVDANIKILSGDTTFTLEDRALLAEYSAKLYDTDTIRKMRIE